MNSIKKIILATLLIPAALLLTGCDQVEEMKQGTLDELDQVFDKAKDSLDKAKDTIDSLTNNGEASPTDAPSSKSEVPKTEE